MAQEPDDEWKLIINSFIDFWNHATVSRVLSEPENEDAE
jgi:hypothetical protein